MHKTIRSLLLLTLLGTTLALAAPQAPPDATKPAQGEMATYRNRLALTADQQAQFRTILQDRKAQMANIRNDASLAPKARKQQMKSLRAETDAKLRAVLNENQLAEYDQISRERRDRALRNRQTALPPQ